MSYDEITHGKPPQKLFGCGSLPRLNEDIVESMDYCSLMLPSKLSHLDVKLKPNLVEHANFEFVSAEGWEVL